VLARPPAAVGCAVTLRRPWKLYKLVLHTNWKWRVICQIKAVLRLRMLQSVLDPLNIRAAGDDPAHCCSQGFASSCLKCTLAMAFWKQWTHDAMELNVAGLPGPPPPPPPVLSEIHATSFKSKGEGGRLRPETSSVETNLAKVLRGFPQSQLCPFLAISSSCYLFDTVSLTN
jgi:hypothetical protein